MEDTRTWPALARGRLTESPQAGAVANIYIGLTLGISLLVTLLVFALDQAIAQTSGLGDMGKRTFLSTLQTIAPMGQSLFLLCLDLGFVAAMLRVSRGQFLSPNTLRLGFARFWVLLRATALQAVMYILVGVPAAYLALSVYMLTPWGDSLVDALVPMMTQTSISAESYGDMAQAMGPCLAVCGCVMLLAMAVMSYRFRMVPYILIDKPGTGALAALRESRKWMRGNCRKLFRLDLRLWWYYAALALATLAGDLDQILAYVGVELPLSSDAAYYLAYGLSLALMCLCYRFLRPQAEVTWAFAYDALKPQEPQQGTVLGNIFQM